MLADQQAQRLATVVEMWASWCPPCRTSIPHLTALQKKFPQVAFVGLTTEKLADAQQFVAKMGASMDYSVCVDVSGKVNQAYMSAVGAKGIPTAFVINKHGRIVWSGHPMDSEFEEQVKRVDAEVVVAPVVVPQSRDELAALKIKVCCCMCRASLSQPRTHILDLSTCVSIYQSVFSFFYLSLLPSQDLKSILEQHNIQYRECVEKDDFVQLILTKIVDKKA